MVRTYVLAYAYRPIHTCKVYIYTYVYYITIVAGSGKDGTAATPISLYAIFSLSFSLTLGSAYTLAYTHAYIYSHSPLAR